MKPAPFEYHRAHSLREAVSLLAEFDGYAIPLAGGQTLMPLMNLRLVQPERVVDISHIDSITQCREEPDAVVLGAGCTHAVLEDNRVPDPSNGLLARVAGGIAYRSIRNRGTIGGSLAYADPAAEWPVVMTALGAEIAIESKEGERTVPVGDFVTGAMSTALSPDELLKAVRIPNLPQETRWGFRKLSRKPGDFAQALAAVIVGEDASAVIGATPDGLVSLPRVARYLGELATLDEDSVGDLETEFREDVSGVDLDFYEQQIHWNTLSRAIKDVFDQ